MQSLKALINLLLEIYLFFSQEDGRAFLTPHPPPNPERTKAAGDRQTNQTDIRRPGCSPAPGPVLPPPTPAGCPRLSPPRVCVWGVSPIGVRNEEPAPGLAPPPRAGGAAELRPTQNGCAGPGRREPEPSMEGGIARRLPPLLSRRDRSPPNAGGKRQPAPPGYGAAGGVSGSCR